MPKLVKQKAARSFNVRAALSITRDSHSNVQTGLMYHPGNFAIPSLPRWRAYWPENIFLTDPQDLSMTGTAQGFCGVQGTPRPMKLNP